MYTEWEKQKNTSSREIIKFLCATVTEAEYVILTRTFKMGPVNLSLKMPVYLDGLQREPRVDKFICRCLSSMSLQRGNMNLVFGKTF